jgi:hypothetical protein
MDGKIRIVMEVAEEGDGEAFQPLRPTTKRNFLANNSRKVGCDQRGIDGKGSHSSGRCKANKFSSGSRKKRQSVSGPHAAGLGGTQFSISSITPIDEFAIWAARCSPTQKLNVACSSILRLAAVPGEKGPPS